MQLELAELVTREQTEAISSGALDLGLARPPFDPETVGSFRLVAEDLMLAVPSDHELASRKGPVTEADVHELGLIMHSPRTARYFYDLTVRLFPVDHQRVVYTVGQITTMVALVRAKRGVALVPESARFLGVDGVTLVPLGERAAGVVELHAIWNRHSANPALHRAIEAISAGTTTD